MKLFSSPISLRKAWVAGERLAAMPQSTPMSCDQNTPLRRIMMVAISFSVVLANAGEKAPPLVIVPALV